MIAIACVMAGTGIRAFSGTYSPPTVEDLKAKAKVKELTPEETFDFDFEATKGKAEKFKNDTLVFKGFYLGMPVSDAQGMINHLLGLKQVTVKPREINGDALAGSVVLP